MPDRKTDGLVAEFCQITGASAKEAKKLLDKYKRLDAAVDAYYDGETASNKVSTTTKLNKLFDEYRESGIQSGADKMDPDIGVHGTIKLCDDLGVDPEDVVLLAVAYELKSPAICRWTRVGWVDGWKSLKCDSIEGMKKALERLGDNLRNDPAYFERVYRFTFTFAREEGQRILKVETAKAFWGLLLPCGMQGKALARRPPSDDSEGDVDMSGDGGWREEYTQLWFDFLDEKGLKGVSKDVWNMFLDLITTMDSEFKTYDPDGPWPSTIDEFVQYVKERL